MKRLAPLINRVRPSHLSCSSAPGIHVGIGTIDRYSSIPHINPSLSGASQRQNSDPTAEHKVSWERLLPRSDAVITNCRSRGGGADPVRDVVPSQRDSRPPRRKTCVGSRTTRRRTGLPGCATIVRSVQPIPERTRQVSEERYAARRRMLL